MTEGTISYIGFGIIVPEAVFAKRFPGTFTIDQFGCRDVNRGFIKSLETNLVSVIWSEAYYEEEDETKAMNPNIFIVAKGYVENYLYPNHKIPYQEMLQTGQQLIPWFEANFPDVCRDPGFPGAPGGPGIYLYTKLSGR